MKNIKRIFSILGIVILVGMYILTLIFALFDNPHTFSCLKISVGLTILIPVLLWIYITMYKFLTRKKESNDTN